MGQMTYGLMYGCKQKPLESWEDGWYEVIGTKDGYNPRKGPRLAAPEAPDIIGFWVAVGASGKRGVPILDDVATDDIRRHPEIGPAYGAAVAAWAPFAAWMMKKHLVTLPEPRLWLVQTEVA